MRLYVGAAILVVVVLGAFWLVLAVTFSNSNGSADAFTRSAACVRDDRSLSRDRSDAIRFRAAGLHALGLRWKSVHVVALFSDSLSPDSVARVETRIESGLRRRGVSASAIAARVLREDNVGLFYVNRPPTPAAQAAIGRCVYLIHFNRIASAVGLYISPHAERPFLPGARRER